MLVIQGSYNPESLTAVLCKAFAEKANERGMQVAVWDAREHDTPPPAGTGEKPKGMHELGEKIAVADMVVFGMPVYCASVSGGLKTIIDWISHDLKNKPIAILEEAGSPMSYMASSDLMNILTFESACQPVMPVVFSSMASYAEGVLTDERVKEKIDELLSNIEKRK